MTTTILDLMLMSMVLSMSNSLVILAAWPHDTIFAAWPHRNNMEF